MKTVAHKGQALMPRIISYPVQTKPIFLKLLPAQTLADQLTRAVLATGANSGYVEIFGGQFQPVSYCVPSGATEDRAVSFSEARKSELVSLIYGSGTIGYRDGQPFVHCHSLWADANDRLRGGHLWPDTFIAGSNARAIIHTISGAEFISSDDPETAMPTFAPYPEKGTAMSVKTEIEPSAVVARVRPNQEITAAIIATCKEYNYKSAVVRAGLGSLVGAAFFDPITKETKLVDGPGTEVIALVGVVTDADTENPQLQLSCTLVDKHGEIHAGELVPGENAVAVTFELVLEKLS